MPSVKRRVRKTRLCRFWMHMDNCRYGDRCRYAHGFLQLESVPVRLVGNADAISQWYNQRYHEGPVSWQIQQPQRVIAAPPEIHAAPPTPIASPRPGSTSLPKLSSQQEGKIESIPELRCKETKSQAVQTDPESVFVNVNPPEKPAKELRYEAEIDRLTAKCDQLREDKAHALEKRGAEWNSKYVELKEQNEYLSYQQNRDREYINVLEDIIKSSKATIEDLQRRMNSVQAQLASTFTSRDAEMQAKIQKLERDRSELVDTIWKLKNEVAEANERIKSKTGDILLLQLSKLRKASSLEPSKFLTWLYQECPPPNPVPLLPAKCGKSEFREAIRKYHPDKAGKFGDHIKILVEEVTKVLNQKVQEIEPE
ncbi:hypothetical protein NEOLI_003020 [Neolecta irregularis DAH-3]|uniref:C3H1-type domain-containing protein n=1 Tax=Neolecta irregularis (strain DAH-3) TaxID=1198029 RepID=A0A1U7LT46_NEOID|nr:hypothetical protein NEOLI_003020 [Neolecta irregularis DAH-3]|eukprot:OLL25845.1 hypothetical protein NEOLI_003020 [Neolecta irregularis DAH-3]